MIFRDEFTAPCHLWSNKMQGIPAFILGNGPSLPKSKLDLIDGLFSIGTNRIFKIYVPTILFWQDTAISDEHEEEIDKCFCLKVCRNTISRNKYLSFSLANDSFCLAQNPSLLSGRGCTGVLAAEFAISLGCSSLILIGCDGDYLGDKTNFYGINTHHNEMTRTYFSNAMKWLKEKSPIPIYNCGYSLFWPKMDIEEAISLTSPCKMPKVKYFARLIS